MQFIDEAKIFIKSGRGGDGCVSFRREAHTPRGGPDGGNGGRGGNVTFKVKHGLNTLIDFRYKQHFKARAGMHGMGKMRDGSKGEDLIIEVPLGTQIIDEHGDHLIADMSEDTDEFLILKGGDGGMGNSNFKSSVNQAPRRATKGFDADDLWVWLKLKLISDVGLVGLPNAGKSTFLSKVSAARPKIADYPFTTLKPQLGVASIDNKEFVIADIPGLIEGASEGKGLGHRFLKHVERCKTILHLLDITQDDFIEHYHTIRAELENYSPILAEKKEVIALTKIDSVNEEILAEKVSQFKNEFNTAPNLISSVANKGLEPLLRILENQIND